MKFGVFLGSSMASGGQSGGEPGGEAIFPSLVAQARLMEQCGYDVALLGERHQRAGGYVDTFTTMAWLLAHTARLRVGSGGFILPIHHPYRLAQQSAALDHASGGRVVFGAVLGYNQGDFAPFGIRTEERVGRFAESLGLIRRLWTGERTTHHGRYWTLEDAFIAPAALRPAGPPVWIGAKVDAAIRRAAALGDGWFASANDGVEALRTQIDVYRQARAAAGKPAGDIVLMRDGLVADSAAAARAALEGPLLAKYREYSGWKATSRDRDRYAPSYDEALPRLVVGSASECVDQVGAYADLGVTTLVLRCQFPGLGQAATMRCIERFGMDVMPHFSGGTDAIKEGVHVWPK